MQEVPASAHQERAQPRAAGVHVPTEIDDVKVKIEAEEENNEESVDMNDSDLSLLPDLQPTTKDCKSRIPALVSFFADFQQKFESSFSEMKSELLSGISERD